jgi:hypothetical protein
MTHVEIATPTVGGVVKSLYATTLAVKEPAGMQISRRWNPHSPPGFPLFPAHARLYSIVCLRKAARVTRAAAMRAMSVVTSKTTKTTRTGWPMRP